MSIIKNEQLVKDCLSNCCVNLKKKKKKHNKKEKESIVFVPNDTVVCLIPTKTVLPLPVLHFTSVRHLSPCGKLWGLHSLFVCLCR